LPGGSHRIDPFDRQRGRGRLDGNQETMHPELFTLPGGFGIKTYGFCMMVGFLSAVWLAMRRASRVKADPDIVLDLSFLSLVFGVGGARVFYVVHYWQSQFADAPNKLLAVINITQGGLEFLGGFLGAFGAIVIYSLAKRISLRMYMDIMAPSALWGLAFGRLGCFFNGCCFGGVCATAASAPAYPWAVRFPFASPAEWRQWEDREVTLPAELITVSHEAMQAWPLSDELLRMSVARREGPRREMEEMRRALQEAKAAAPDAEETERLEAEAKELSASYAEHRAKLRALELAQAYPSRVQPHRQSSVTEIADLAVACSSLPVHPTQLYSAIHAMILSGLLSALFYVRKRHGVVIAAIFVLYPVPRMLLESIRADNPTDVAGLTVSQSVGVGMLIAGVAALVVLYKWMPERSAYAVAKPAEE